MFEHWLQRWEQNNIPFHESKPNPYLLRHFSKLPIPSKSRVLVPLCGKSVDMNWLADQGHEVVGIELSELAVEQFFEEQNVQAEITSEKNFKVYRSSSISIYQGDFFQLHPNEIEPFDWIYDRAALIALPPGLRIKYAQQVSTLLKPTGFWFLISMEYPASEMEGPPYRIDESEIRALFQSYSEIESLETKEIPVEKIKLRSLSKLTEVVWFLSRK